MSNDVLTIAYDPTEVLKKIDKYFGLNPGSLPNPNIYLDGEWGSGVVLDPVVIYSGFREEHGEICQLKYCSSIEDS